jgi:hypothetical protein
LAQEWFFSLKLSFTETYSISIQLYVPH